MKIELEPKHFAIIAAFLAGIGVQLGTAQHGWVDIATPGFVAGLLIQLSSAITAIFVGAPGANAALDQANKNTDMANDSVRAALSGPPLDAGKVDPKRFIGTGLIVLALAFGSACASHQNTAQLSAQGVSDLHVDQVVKLINDVTDGAIGANRAGQLADPLERAVLTVNKQVLDVITAHPADAQGWVMAAFTNARDGLPPDVQAKVGAYLDRVAEILGRFR